ncbi:hypothetical protein IT084_01760 [Desulfallas sp. Bu1-1]|uniref:hypothetical protein n=1 Tax=Desulfallas sp. Bu1-1 TaxID=2787620 RepID=UPI00189F953C|nr:hypothetical protein [Desulfallas sp. Bu1-1]MBF7081708.1 hypothetical protein [Desulfallas sp. Bu1-1]
MIKIIIEDNEIDLKDLDEGWVNQQINKRRQDGFEVCVQVKIQEGNLNMHLSTPTCQKPSGGGGRAPNDDEKKVFMLWEQMGLNSRDFTGGKLIAFLKRLQSYY